MENSTKNTTMVTVSLSLADVDLVTEILTHRIDSYSNWLEGAVLADNHEYARRLATERNHLQTVVRSAFRHVLMEHGEI